MGASTQWRPKGIFLVLFVCLGRGRGRCSNSQPLLRWQNVRGGGRGNDGGGMVIRELGYCTISDGTDLPYLPSTFLSSRIKHREKKT